MSIQHQTVDNADVRRGESLGAAAFAILLGTFILFGVGFAQPHLLHDAAHDSRHSFAFPCH